MSDDFQILPATRQSIIPVIGVMGESGGGKTYTSLLIARGLVGPDAKIAGIDTENKRMQIFSSMVPGGFDVINLEPPFNPQRYQAAITMIVRAGYKAIVVDSATHEWAGEGGYLDMKNKALDRMAGEDWAKREKCGMAAAAQCKPLHNRFVDFCIRLPIPLILCFRAFQKTKIDKGTDNKIEIKTDQYVSPIQDDRFIYEMILAGEVYANEEGIGGYWSWKGRGKKHSHPDILKIFPEGQQIGVAHGAALAAWCAQSGGGSSVKPKAKPGKATDATRSWMLSQLKPIEQRAHQYAIDKGLIMPDEPLSAWPLDRVPTTKTDMVALIRQIEAHQ